MMRRRSSKQGGAETKPGVSSHMLTLHQRLYHALNLGLRSYGYQGRKWHSLDIGIQRLVLRSIDAFLDCISVERSQHTLVKDSIADMVGALEGILLFTNEATLSLASNVALKMVNIVPSLILESPVFDLVRPLTSLLTSHERQAAVSCATALKLILSKLNSKREGEVWEILKETDTVFHIVNNIRDFSYGTMPIEYFLEMVSLLGEILWRWQSFRLCVWSDAKLMEILGVMSLKPDFSVKVAVLQSYSALALCGNGAQKLLENAETVLPLMVQCMDESISVSVRTEGFKLAQCLAINQQGCSKMMSLCCEPVVKAIINGLSSCTSTDHLVLKMEACRFALITRWAGEHHKYFWKLGVDRVLLSLLLNNFHSIHQSQHYFSSLEEKIATAQQGLRGDDLLSFRPFIWDILGGLATHSLANFHPKMHGNEFCIDILIICACLAFLDSIQNKRRLYHYGIAEMFRNESACRSVLMMMCSPCEYIASRARFLLSEILRPNGKEYLKYLLDKLSQPRSKLGILDNLRTVVYLISLTCFSGLQQYQKRIVSSQGVKVLVAFIRWCLSNNVHMRRATVAPHLRCTFIDRTCCSDHTEDWDGDNSPLLFSLWALAELMHQSSCVETYPDIFTGQVDYKQLVGDLQGICSDTSTPGPRWYAAYILSYFGLYGFPDKLGKRIGKAHNEKELTDLDLVLKHGEPLSVHGVILMARCPSLLPPQGPRLIETTFEGSLVRKDAEKCERLRKEVHLSAHVDREALLKLLEYVYLGHLQAGVELVKKLKAFARHCNLQCLYQMLCKRSPKWGTPFPTLGLTFALEPDGHYFSDIILEAEAADLINWACPTNWRFPTCSVSVPHMHVHKVILSSSSMYFQGMFRSGMQESRSKTIKAPVSWAALIKVVKWFYSDELPKPISGCLWDNLDAEEKLHQLYLYIELCWLAEYWFLGNDLHKYCTRVVISSLDSARHLSIKVIQIAASLYQNKLVEVAAHYMAPLYQRLLISGELEELDEELVEMVRAASVRLSIAGDYPRT